MNLPENQLDSILRRAPVPTPPSGLEADLVRNVRLEPAADPRDGRAVGCPPRAARPVRRWWTLLLPGLATAALATALVVQQNELSELRTELASLQTGVTGAGDSDPAAATDPNSTRLGLTERQDLERLRALVDQLTREVASLETLRKDNEALQTALRAAQAALPKELREAAELADRAGAIKCVNNLKQLGLAVRIWATDHKDDNPPDIPSMSSEIVVPQVLICPADDVRHAAADWSSYTAANCSYEYLSPGPGVFQTEPSRVLFRCPFHGNVGLCDGSVQMALAKTHPERFETVNGALYLKADLVTPQPSPTGGGSLPAEVMTELQKGTPVSMPPELARRYGIAPGQVVQTVTTDGKVTAIATNVTILPSPQP